MKQITVADEAKDLRRVLTKALREGAAVSSLSEYLKTKHKIDGVGSQEAKLLLMKLRTYKPLDEILKSMDM